MGYATPTPVAKGPRKRRPPALLIDNSLVAQYDDDSSTRRYSLGCGEEVPVRRTFIDFGSLVGTPPSSPGPTRISTAPARMANFSIRETFETWKVVATAAGDSPSGASCTIVACAPSSTASSTRLTVTTDCSVLHDLEQFNCGCCDEIRGKAKRALLSAAKSGTLEAALKRTLKGADGLPDVTYRLSPISMKAAGYWTPQTSTPRSPSGAYSEQSDPSSLLQDDLRKDGFGANRCIVPKPITKPEGLDAAAWAQLYAQFEPPQGRRIQTLAADATCQSPSSEHFEPSCRLVSGSAGGLTEADDHDAEEISTGSDDDSSDEDILGLCPTYAEGVPLPSAGSARHGEGTCKRCCFFPKGRCSNGYDCQFCHFAHEKRKAKNKKKKKKRRKNKLAATGQKALFFTSNSVQSSQASKPQSPTAQHVFGSYSSQWVQPPNRPSGLVCHGLNFVPPTARLPGTIPGAVLPGYPIVYPQQVIHQVDTAYSTWPSHH